MQKLIRLLSGSHLYHNSERTAKFYMLLKLLTAVYMSWSALHENEISCSRVGCILKSIIKVPYCLLRWWNEMALLFHFETTTSAILLTILKVDTDIIFTWRGTEWRDCSGRTDLWPCECWEHARTYRIASLFQALQPLCSCCWNPVPRGYDCRISFSVLNGILRGR